MIILYISFKIFSLKKFFLSLGEFLQLQANPVGNWGSTGSHYSIRTSDKVIMQTLEIEMNLHCQMLF